jgi:hypothetical protein
MGIFKNITNKIKEYAPTIGSAIGMFYGGPLGASIGSGIGSLVAGKDAGEALRNAALTGAATYAAGGKDFGKGFKFSTADSPLRGMFGASRAAGPDVITSVKTGGESFLSKLIPESTMGKVALLGGIGSLAALGDEPEMIGSKPPPFAKGRSRLGQGMVDGMSFNLNNKEERDEYFRRVREKQGFTDFKSDKDKDKNEDREVFVDPIRASEGGMAEFEMKLPPLNDTRNFAEKMSYKDLRHNVKAGKIGYTEAELRMIQNELAKREAPKTPMMPMASVGDPSQLMRTFMVGGEVRGPGSGTSDSVPARLSDGEFVLTAKAIRGAGGGDRDLGAARMYDMMSELERIA